MKTVVIAIKLGKALLKPIESLLEKLADGKVSKDEKNELLMEIASTVVTVLADLLSDEE